MSDMNQLQWRGLHLGHRGHYEGWYITAVDPEQGLGFWMRYTILVPAEGVRSISPSASLWGFVFELDDPAAGFQFRDDHPLSAFKSDPKRFALRIADASLDGKSAKGQVGYGSETMSWDLKLGPSRLSWAHFDPRLYRMGIAKTCVQGPRLDMNISGVVTCRGKRYELKDIPGEQSHLWGKKPTDYYAWAHCNAFEDGAVFEGLSAKLRKGPWHLPAAGPLLVSGEDRFELRGFFDMFGVKSEQDYGLWTFEAQSRGALLTGRVSSPPERCVAVEYADPQGGPSVFCHNTILADIELELFRRVGGRWESKRRYSAEASAAFEITREKPDPRVKRVLTLAGGRKLG